MADISAVKELTDKLENGMKDLFESDKYAAYLQTMSRFHRYSTRNTLLIHMQMPTATRCAGYNDWKNKFKRQVKKGEKGIRIFAPVPFVVKEELAKLDPVTKKPIIGADGQPIMEEYIKMQSARFKVVPVFDVSQTDGEPLPELVEALTGDVARYELFMDALRAVSPLPIVFEDMPTDTDGACHFGDRIAIRNGMSEIQTVSAVIHEIAHAKLHDLQVVKENGGEPKDRRTEEVEAESISYAICQYYGIETGANSFGYLAEWSKSRELKELNASLDTIRKTVAELLDGIDEQYRALAKERGIDLSVEASIKEADDTVSLVNQPESEPYTRGGFNNDKKLAAVREQYGEKSFQYETIKQDMELPFEEYTAMLGSLDAELNKRGYSMANTEYTSQDYLNDYLDEVDLHPDPNDFVKIVDYIVERSKTSTVADQTPESTVNPVVSALIDDYARNAKVTNHIVGTNVLMTPVFDDSNFNREGKKIRVKVEEMAGKYQLFSHDEHSDKVLYFMTASGRIDRVSEYFRDEWNEQTHKWENYRPSEAEFDEVIPQIAARFESDMADPTKWTMYQHAAVVNRLDECEAHNIPVRQLRAEEEKTRREEAERERQEEKRQKQEKFDARVDEIAGAIRSGKTISVGYDEDKFDGKNPVLDLFRLYDIDLPLRTQGWVNTGLAEITDGSYRYYKSKHKGDSTTFGVYLKNLREAINLTPIEQIRVSNANPDNAVKEAKNTVENKLYEKLTELFPDFMSGKYSYLRLESDGFEPLSLEWVFGDRLSIMHTYEMNGDLCYDPMIEYLVNSSERTLTATMFQQSMPPLYQYHDDNGVGRSVDGNGNTRIAKNLRAELHEFSESWFQNISEQGFMPVKANLVIGEDEEVRVTFDEDGKMIMPEPDGQQPGYEQWSEPATADDLAQPSIASDNIADYLPKATEIDLSQPDPAIGSSEMNLYGYDYVEMLPLLQARAVELFDSDHCVYLLYPDNTESMALDRDEILKHDGLCGIERADWEKSPVYAAQMAIAANAEGKREADLLYGDGNMFGIYQIKDGIDAARDFRFAPMRELEAHGLTVDRANYELVYTAPFSERIEFLTDRYPLINKLYEQFNINHPADFTGHSLSVSDVIVLKCNGDISSHFVDSAGFAEIDTFLGEESHREAAKREAERTDLTLSQVGNRSDAPTVAELENTVKAGGVISISDLSRAVNAEHKPPISRGKPSLLGKLEQNKQRAAQQGQPETRKNDGLEV